jgi:hypothetical protein
MDTSWDNDEKALATVKRMQEIKAQKVKIAEDYEKQKKESGELLNLLKAVDFDTLDEAKATELLNQVEKHFSGTPAAGDVPGMGPKAGLRTMLDKPIQDLRNKIEQLKNEKKNERYEATNFKNSIDAYYKELIDDSGKAEADFTGEEKDAMRKKAIELAEEEVDTIGNPPVQQEIDDNDKELATLTKAVDKAEGLSKAMTDDADKLMYFTDNTINDDKFGSTG